MADDMNIFPLGRSDTVMKVNGYRITPEALERAAEAAPGVKRAVAFGVRDLQKFETTVVVVAGDVQPDELRRRIREYVGAIAEPAKIVALEAMPDAPKPELRAALKAYLWRGAAADGPLRGWVEEVARRLK
jgi:Acyl-coenzyme A synthetases/AMP-(fatty) acid ligases